MSNMDDLQKHPEMAAAMWGTVKLILGAIKEKGLEVVLDELREHCPKHGPTYSEKAYTHMIEVMETIKDGLKSGKLGLLFEDEDNAEEKKDW